MSSRMLKELKNLTPWNWDKSKHPPGEKALRDFSTVEQALVNPSNNRKRRGGDTSSRDCSTHGSRDSPSKTDMQTPADRAGPSTGKRKSGADSIGTNLIKRCVDFDGTPLAHGDAGPTPRTATRLLHTTSRAPGSGSASREPTTTAHTPAPPPKATATTAAGSHPRQHSKHTPGSTSGHVEHTPGPTCKGIQTPGPYATMTGGPHGSGTSVRLQSACASVGRDCATRQLHTPREAGLLSSANKGPGTADGSGAAPGGGVSGCGAPGAQSPAGDVPQDDMQVDHVTAPDIATVVRPGVGHHKTPGVAGQQHTAVCTSMPPPPVRPRPLEASLLLGCDATPQHGTATTATATTPAVWHSGGQPVVELGGGATPGDPAAGQAPGSASYSARTGVEAQLHQGGDSVEHVGHVTTSAGRTGAGVVGGVSVEYERLEGGGREEGVRVGAAGMPTSAGVAHTTSVLDMLQSAGGVGGQGWGSHPVSGGSVRSGGSSDVTGVSARKRPRKPVKQDNSSQGAGTATAGGQQHQLGGVEGQQQVRHGTSGGGTDGGGVRGYLHGLTVATTRSAHVQGVSKGDAGDAAHPVHHSRPPAPDSAVHAATQRSRPSSGRHTDCGLQHSWRTAEGVQLLEVSQHLAAGGGAVKDPMTRWGPLLDMLRQQEPAGARGARLTTSQATTAASPPSAGPQGDGQGPAGEQQQAPPGQRPCLGHPPVAGAVQPGQVDTRLCGQPHEPTGGALVLHAQHQPRDVQQQAAGVTACAHSMSSSPTLASAAIPVPATAAAPHHTAAAPHHTAAAPHHTGLTSFLTSSYAQELRALPAHQRSAARGEAGSSAAGGGGGGLSASGSTNALTAASWVLSDVSGSEGQCDAGGGAGGGAAGGGVTPWGPPACPLTQVVSAYCQSVGMAPTEDNVADVQKVVGLLKGLEPTHVQQVLSQLGQHMSTIVCNRASRDGGLDILPLTLPSQQPVDADWCARLSPALVTLYSSLVDGHRSLRGATLIAQQGKAAAHQQGGAPTPALPAPLPPHNHSTCSSLGQPQQHTAPL